MKIDEKLRGKLPSVESPAPFLSPDGAFRGWRVVIPGRRPLATPAVAGGRVFLGGGFGSFDFYAFDAATGTVAWQYQTTDDGPTAAVVADDHVVFNTESCELEVLTVAGKPVWKKWLGDPLMSMPAVADGRVYMAYPDSKGDHRHHLACFDLKTGHEYWKQPIEGEIITAPVLAEGDVHFATLAGTLYRVNRDSGRVEGKEPRRATSSPVVWEGEAYFSQREEVVDQDQSVAGVQQTEHLSGWRYAEQALRHYRATSRRADYLDHAKRAARSPQYTASEHLDAAVGFAAFKGDAKMHHAALNLGKSHVHAVWAYQGSKPFVWRARLYAAQGDIVSAADPRSDHVYWKKTVGSANGEDKELLDHPLTPPAIVNGKLFFGSVHGLVHCVAADSGEELWSVPVGEPVIFQPAVSNGRVYVGTDAGSLVCVETGDANDDGWLMWGADAAHNGRVS
jgi:Ca-activated chloride channel family protein